MEDFTSSIVRYGIDNGIEEQLSIQAERIAVQREVLAVALPGTDAEGRLMQLDIERAAEALGRTREAMAASRAMFRLYLADVGAAEKYTRPPSPNAQRALEFFFTNAPFVESVNAAAGTLGRLDLQAPYGNLFRAVLTGPFSPALTEMVSEKMTGIDSEVRPGIVLEAMKEMSDEEVSDNADMLLRTLAGDPLAMEDAQLLSVRAYMDRQFVLARLAGLGKATPPVIDQDALYERIIDENNEFAATFDELLTLEVFFHPEGSSVSDLIAKFNAWKADPERGGKRIVLEEGFIFRLSHMAVGAAMHDAEKLAFDEASRLADAYIRTGSYEVLAEYIGNLLFERSTTGIALYEKLVAEGHKDHLLLNEQILKAYGLALAKHGQIEKARSVAMAESQKYDDYAYIGMEIARYLRNEGRTAEAIQTIDDLTDIDPLLNFVHNTTPDEHIGMMGGSPTGFIFEDLAEEYALNGAYDKAIAIYKRSRQYPDQAEPRMAEIALSAGDAEAYAEAIAGFDADEHDMMFMCSRLTVALLKKIDERVPVGIQADKLYPDLYRNVAGFAERLESLLAERTDSLSQRVLRKALVDIYTYTGNAERAMQMLQLRSGVPILDQGAFVEIVVQVAKQGNYRDAIKLFKEHVGSFGDSFTLGDKMRLSVIMMGQALLRGDTPTFRQFYEDLPGYRRSTAMFSMLRFFRDFNLRLNHEMIKQLVYYQDDINEDRPTRINTRLVAQLPALLGRQEEA